MGNPLMIAALRYKQVVEQITIAGKTVTRTRQATEEEKAARVKAREEKEKQRKTEEEEKNFRDSKPNNIID
jgi:hypothetical protein